MSPTCPKTPKSATWGLHVAHMPFTQQWFNNSSHVLMFATDYEWNFIRFFLLVAAKLQNFHFARCLPKDIRTQRSFSWCSCEKRTEVNNSLDIWLGQIAMLSIVAFITIEITTGKGVLQVWVLFSCFIN